MSKRKLSALKLDAYTFYRLYWSIWWQRRMDVSGGRGPKMRALVNVVESNRPKKK